VITTRRQVAILLIAILAVGVVNGLMGLYQFLFQVGPGGFLIGRFMRAYGTFGQPNPYGGYLNLSLPILYALLLFSISQREQWRYAIPLGIGLAVGGVALMATLSRGAWIGAAMALVTVSLVHSRRSLLITGAVGILSLTVVLLSTASIVPTAVAERLLSVGEYFRIFDVREVKVTDANFSIVERMAHWQAAMGMVEDRPLTGYGIGNYAAAYEAYQLPGWSDPLGHAHNIMLNMAAETGLIGASSYVLLLASALWLIWQRVRSLKGWERSIALGILGVLVAKISHEMLDNLWVHYMGLHIALLLSMVAVLPTVAQEETPTHP
jgi:O-antigen ligase